MKPDCRVLPVACLVLACSMLLVPVAGTMGPALGGVDIGDSNIRMVVLATKEECSAACDAEPACVAATFVLPGTIQGPDGHCYLKSASTPQTDNFNCYSFVKVTGPPAGGGCAGATPSADFSAAPESTTRFGYGFAPLTIRFTDLSTGATAWSWNFGDGSPPSTDRNPVHVFTTGTTGGSPYTVSLNVQGACPGQTGTHADTVTVYDNLGFLLISSNPGGARIFLDGNDLGKTTQSTHEENIPVTAGTHTVRLTLNGYQDASYTFTVGNEMNFSFGPLLETATQAPAPAPAAATPGTGTLQISTSPGGAAIMVDGGAQGTTPATIAGLGAGSHTIQLVKTGYTDYTGTLTVPAGKTTVLDITLVAEQGTYTTTTLYPQPPQGTVPVMATPASAGTATVPATGSLTVRSEPAGANVYLDGEKEGTTPVTIPDIAAGTHRLLLTLPGYGDTTQTVTIAAGVPADVTVTFAGKKAPGFGMTVSFAAPALAAMILLRRKAR